MLQKSLWILVRCEPSYTFNNQFLYMLTWWSVKTYLRFWFWLNGLVPQFYSRNTLIINILDEFTSKTLLPKSKKIFSIHFAHNHQNVRQNTYKKCIQMHIIKHEIKYLLKWCMWHVWLLLGYWDPNRDCHASWQMLTYPWRSHPQAPHRHRCILWLIHVYDLHYPSIICF